MNLHCKHLRNFLLSSCLTFFSFGSAFSQSTVVISAASPIHQTLDQRTIRSVWNLTLAGGTDITQWTVFINGISTGISVTGLSETPNIGPFTTSINPTTKVIGIQFDASGASGHSAATPYLLPGETLTFSFNNTGNTLTTATAPCIGCPVVAFGPLTSKNLYAPSAPVSADIQYQSEGIASSLDQCSPVNTNFYRWTYTYSLRYRNSSAWSTNNNQLHVSWGSGASTSDLQGYLSNSGGDPSVSQSPVNIFTVTNYPCVYVSFRTGLNITSANAGVINVDNGMAYSFSYPNNTGVCNFLSTEYPTGITTAVYSASGLSTLQKNTQFNSYDYDSHLPGTMGMTDDPIGTNGATTTNQVCVGTNVGAALTDNSLFNCIGNGAILSAPAANPNTSPVNNAQRWVRIVYGGVSAATVIPDIHVNGAQVTTNAAVSTLNPLYVSNPVVTGAYGSVTDTAPNIAPLQNGYVVPGVGAFPAATAGTTDIYGVTALNVAANATTSGLISQLISTLDPSNQVIGQQFNVTIQYWNVCNPYPTSSPVEYTTTVGANNAIQIIGKPTPLTATGLSLCYNAGTPVNFSVGGVTGGATVKFYKDKATATAHGATIQSGASANLASTKYTTGNGLAVNFSTTNTSGSYFSVWATQFIGTCESDPIEVAIYQQPQISVLATDVRNVPTPSPAPDVCNNTSVVYTEGQAVPVKIIAANTSTNSVAINLSTENVWSSTLFGATVTITPSGSPNGTASYAYAISPQPATFVTGNVAVALQYVTPDITNSPANVTVKSTFPAPASPSSYSYTINPQTCTNTATTLSQKVYGTSAGGDISPATQTICSATAPATITVAGTGPLPLRGSVVGWQKRVNGSGGFTVDGTLGVANPLILAAANVPLVAGVQTTYEYQAIVQNGPCTSALGTIATVIVNPVPAQPTITPSGPTTFCLGGSVTLTSSNADAAAYQWYKGGAAIVGATAQTYLINAIAQNGSYTVQTIGVATSNCLSAISNPVVVTVNPLPTASGPTGGGAVCSGNPAPDIVWVLAGSSPYSGTWTDGTTTFPFTAAGVTQTPTSLTVSTPNTLVAGTYQLVSLTDANGCSAVSLGGTASITIGGTPPTFSVAPALSPVSTCDNGGSTTDPQLNFTLDALSASKINFILTYKIDGSANRTKTFSTNAASQPTASITFSDAELNSVGGHTLTVVSIISAAGCLSTFNTPLTFTVNPLPSIPSGVVNSIACSSGGGSPMSVTDPGAGFTIMWSTTGPAIFTNAVPGFGAATGSNKSIFTPTSSASATFYAFSQDNVTACMSSSGVAITQTQDVAPAVAFAGANQPNVCGLTSGSPVVTLTATAATNSGIGGWTLPGKISYYQNFQNASENNTTSSTALNGWSLSFTTPANSFVGGLGYAKVTSNHFEFNNTNGTNGTGAGNVSEVVWTSPLINTTSLSSVSASVDLIEVAAINGLPEDYIQAYYKVNGGGLTLFPVNGSQTVGGFGTKTATASGLATGTLQIIIKASVDGAGETLAFDNLKVFDPSSSSIALADANDPATSVTGLPAPPPGGTAISTTLTWTVSSAFGVCANSSSSVIITINPLPTSIDPAPQLCEDVALGGSHAGVDLTSYNPSVTNTVAVPGTAVAWFTNAARTLAVGTPTNVSVTNGKIFYFIATSPAPFNCTNTGQITFTVNALPTVVNQNLSFCEDHVGVTPIPPNSNQHGPFDLTAYETAIANGSLSNRSVSWFTNAGATIALASPNTYTLVGSQTLYAKVTNTITNCFNIATVNLSIKPRPSDNPIVGNATVCTGNNILLYQLDPTFNSGSTYTWSVAGTPAADVTLFGGGGTNSPNFFVLLKFPSATGTVSIDVFETLNGCDGNTSHMTVNVNSAPTANTIIGVTQVCTNQTSVTYSVTPFAGNATSNYSWLVGAGASNTGSLTVNSSAIKVDFGTINPVTIQVTETSSSGCVGTPASTVVAVNTRPSMTSSNTGIVCSGLAPSTVFTSDISSSFGWKVTNITGTLSNVSVGNTGSGDLSTTFTGLNAIKNTSGSAGFVTFDVTPTTTAAPNCAGSPQSFVLTVNPEPVVNPQSTTSCSNTAVNYAIQLTPSSLPTGTQFTWSPPSMSDASSQGTGRTVAASAALHITDVLVNTLSSPIHAFYNVTASVPATGCSAPASTQIDVTVNPEPIMNTPSPNVCSKNTIGVTFSGAGGSTPINTYNLISVSYPTVSGFTAALSNVVPANNKSASYISNDIYTNTTGATVDVTYVAQPVGTNNCTGASVTITVHVQPQPSLSGSLDKTVCSGLATNLDLLLAAGSATTSGFNIISETIDPGLSANAGNAVVNGTTNNEPHGYLSGDRFINTTGGNLDVVYQVVPVGSLGSCPGNPPQSITITILPEPVLSTSTTPVCSAQPTGYTMSVITGSVSASTFDIISVVPDGGLTTVLSSATQTGVLAGYLSGDTFIDKTPNPLFVTYQILPHGSSCSGQTYTVKVKINPEPILVLSSPTVCSEAATNLNLSYDVSSVAAATYNITNRVIASGLSPDVANANVPATGKAPAYLANDKFTNLTSGPLTVLYSVVPVSSVSCAGVAQDYSVTINPEPFVSTSLSSFKCSRDVINLTLATGSGSATAGSYNLLSINVPAGLTPGGSNKPTANGVAANYLLNDLYTNTTNGPIDVQYTVTATSAAPASCAGQPQVITITINPEPVVSTTLDGVVCSGNPINLNLTTNGVSVGASSYNIISVSLPGLTAGGTNQNSNNVTNKPANYLANDFYTNTSTTTQLVTYMVQAVSAAGCSGPSQSISFTINPEPVLVGPFSSSACSGNAIALNTSVSLSAVTVSGFNVTGRTIDPSLAPAGTNAAVTATGVLSNYLANDKFNNKTPGPHNVTYTIAPVGSIGSCIGASQLYTIQINPEPILLPPSPAITVCSGIATGLILATDPSSVGAASYTIVSITPASGLVPDGGNATAGSTTSITYLSNDKFLNTSGSQLSVTYLVIPISGAPCSGSGQSIIVNINPEPVVSPVSDVVVCSGGSISPINFSSNTGGGEAYTWTNTNSAIGLALSGSGNISGYTSPVNTSSGSLIGNLSVSASKNGCTSTGTNKKNFSITIYPQPLAPALTSANICSGQSVNQDLQAIVNSVGGNSLPSKFKYTLTADLPSNLSPNVTPGTFDRTVASTTFITDVFSNYSGGDVTLTYTVTPLSTAHDCQGDPFVFKVVIHSEPVGQNYSEPSCLNSLNFNIQSKITNGVGSVFTYTVSSDNGGVVPAANRTSFSNLPITDTYSNTTGTPANITYTITPKSSANNCVGASFTYKVQINATPTANNTFPGTLVCSGTSLNIDPQGNITNGVIASFSWTANPDAGFAVQGTLSGSGNITGTWKNKTNGVLNILYTITPSVGTCPPGNPFTINQRVNPEPVMKPSLANSTICSNNTFSGNPTNITLTTDGVSVPASTFDIVLISQDFGLNGTPTTGVGLLATAIKNDVFNNVTASPLKVIYQVTPKSSAPCTGDPLNITVTVNPEPVITSGLDNTICSRDVAGISLATNGSSVGAGSYKLLTVAIPGLITAGSNTTVNTVGGITLIKNDTYTNKSNGNQIVNYSIVPISGVNCFGQPLTINLTVKPEPILAPGGTVPTCSGAAAGALIALGAQGGSATIDQYILKQVLIAGAMTPAGTNVGLGTYSSNSFLESDIFTNTANISFTVTYTIAPSASGCSGGDQIATLQVNPAPAVSASLDATICSGSSSGITFATTSTSAPARAALGYFVTGIVPSVTAPQLQPNGSNVGTNTTTGVAAGYVNGDKFVNNSNTKQTVTYSVQAITAASCTGPIQYIVLTIEPTIVADPVSPTSICSNGTTNVKLTSSSVPTAGPISFNYTAVSTVGGQLHGFIPSVSNLPNGYIIADNLVNNSSNLEDVNYTITPVASGAKGGNGCTGSPIVVIVHVEPIPKLTAAPPTQTVCEGVASSIHLTTTSSPNAGIIQFNVVSIMADPGLSSTTAPGPYAKGQDIADVWINNNTVPGTVTYTLQPVVNGGLGCSGDPVTIILNVNPIPTISSTIINPTLVPAAICSNDFVNISIASDVSSTVNQWSASVIIGTAKGFSNGAGDLIFQTLKNTGVVPATVRYHVTPKAASCTGSPIDVDINVDPIPDVLLTNPTPVCYGATLNVPLNSSVAGTNFNWTVDSNNSGVDTTPTSGTSINYVVKDTLTSAEDFLTFTIAAVGPGSTACPSASKIMPVLASPKMDGIFQNDSTWLCTGSNDFLQISLQGQAPFTLQYSDGSSTFTSTRVGNFKSIQVEPATSTTYSLLSLKDNLGCTTLLTDQVVFTVDQTDPSFDIISPFAACTPDVTSFQYNQRAGTSYDWHWGDGNDSTYVATTNTNNEIIRHAFINTSLTSTLKPNVILTTSLDSHFPNGCSKSSTKSISVYAQLKTSVAIDKSAICSGDVVRLSNQTVGVPSTGHKWFYRDAGNATQQLEVRATLSTTYTLSTDNAADNPHVYEIVYQATNGSCPSDTVIQVTVYKSIKADFTDVVPYFVGGNSRATFNNTSIATTDWPQFRFDWNFGLDASPAILTSSSTPLSVNYSSPGSRDVTLTGTNIAAEAVGLTCSNSVTKTVTVLLAPLLAEFKIDPNRACYPAKIKVTENLSTGDRFSWAVVDRVTRDTVSSSTIPFPVFSISSDGQYVVNLITSSSKTGQTASDTANLVLYPTPEAIFDAFPHIVYLPDEAVTTINGSGNTANQYVWDFGDGSTSTEYQPTYKYKFEGVDSLKFTAQFDHGGGVVCSATSSKIIIAKQGGVAKIPNAFTPSTAGPSGGVGNVDLYNYVFLPQVKGVEEFNMQIYDRWGNLIFESNNQTVGWDGYDQHGRLLAAGVYVYKLTLRLSDQQRTTQVGDVTLIR